MNMARDMTEQQYRKALDRHGFRNEFGIAMRDERENYSVMTMFSDFNTATRRQRLAYLLQNRAQHIRARTKHARQR